MKNPFLIGENVYLRPLLKSESDGKPENSQKNIVLSIVEKESDRFVGVILLQNIDLLNDSAEIVFMSDNDHIGEAGALLVNHGLNGLNLHRIDFKTLSDNRGLIDVVKSLGFVKEAVRREAVVKAGKFIDLFEFGLLKKEWEKMKRNEKKQGAEER